MYKPIVLTSYALNHAFGGYEPTGHHWLNLVFHTCNSILFFLVVNFWTNSRRQAIITALHPVNGETVNYISSRSDSMCAFFFLSSFYSYLRNRGGNPEGRLWYWISILSFARALGAEAVAIILPAILLLDGLLFTPGKLTAKGPFTLFGTYRSIGS